MPLSEQLRKFFDSHKAKYAVSSHHTAYTAREVASVEHLPAREVAKVVVIFGDGQYHMLVLPANRLVDFQEVRHALGLSQARLATEEELGRLFPDCELGAAPPIGRLYDMPTIMDEISRSTRSAVISAMPCSCRFLTDVSPLRQLLK